MFANMMQDSFGLKPRSVLSIAKLYCTEKDWEETMNWFAYNHAMSLEMKTPTIFGIKMLEEEQLQDELDKIKATVMKVLVLAHNKFKKREPLKQQFIRDFRKMQNQLA
eukprot:1268239-Rhodomonas_salina.1